MAINRKEYRIIQNDINSNKTIGLKIPFGSNKSFLSLTNTTEQQIYYNLINLLLTSIGERYHQPTFGTDLRYILFENYTEDVVNRIKSTINKAISTWLPGIIVNSITVREHSNNNVIVDISFVIDTNANHYKTITLFADEFGKINVSGTL